VEKTTDDADLLVTINELGATYLGGSNFVQLRDAGRLSEATHGSAAQASALFRVDRAPWCPEIF
jgi:hypothetical protein